MRKFGVSTIFDNAKKRNFILNPLLFPDEQMYDLSYKVFLESELGQIYQAIPWDELASKFNKPIPRSNAGKKPIFSIKGGLGLMFLKHHLGLSDEKLIQRVNTDWQLQYFCGVHLRFTSPVRDKDIVGRWRRFFGEHMDIDELQDVLGRAWKPYLNNTHTLMDDATCYESYIKYPTDVKLLWDCSEFLFTTINKFSNRLKIAKPRTKYGNQQKKQMSYSKLRRKSKKRTDKRIRELLYWVERGLDLLQDLLNKYPALHDLTAVEVYEKIKTIRVIYGQQHAKFHIPDYRIRHRIVSLYKPYIRPIVRGKENKKVEFGAKVHISQVDHINFIEHLSFEAFHEGIRMWKSISKHIRRFGKCTQYAGDQIYATNKNRKKATKRKIATSFKRKGRASKDEEQKSAMRKALGNARATILEGSFGNEKNHYGLRKIKARLKETEIAWIFFGIHTANAVKIANRIKKQQQKKKEQQQIRLAV